MKITNLKTKDIRDGFFENLFSEFKTNNKIIVISADQGALLLNNFIKFDNKRCLLFNISEQHMVSFASGLALTGYKVFIYAISSFLISKTIEQIKINLDFNPKISLTLIGSGTGLCYSSDGPTHHSLDDLALLRPFKNINILTPSNYNESQTIFNFIKRNGGINYIRLDKGSYLFENKLISISNNTNLLNIKKTKSFKCLISYGVILNNLIQHFPLSYIKINLINFIKINPVSNETINHLKKFNSILVVEESLSNVSLSSILRNSLYGKKINIKEISIKNNNNYIYGSRDYLQNKLLLSKKNLKIISNFVNKP